MGRRWFQIIVIGVVLFVTLEQTYKATSNVKFFPVVILLSAMVVPAAFVAYFYRRERAADRGKHLVAPLQPASTCFFLGGTRGVVLAASIEYQTLRTLGVPQLFGVGLIEESAKLILPVIIYLRWSYRSEADGLLFGVASGMGFAALETMGYGLVTFVQSHGNITSTEEVLLIRSLLSPAGHAAWTGLVAATLWRQRERTGKLFSPIVLGVFITAIVLHALWDIAGTSSHLYVIYPGYAAIGITSFTLLIRRLREIDKPRTTGNGIPM